MHTMGPPSHSAGDQGVVEEIGDHKQVDRTPAGFVSFSDKEEAEAAARGGNLAVWVCGIDKLRVLPYPLAQMLGWPSYQGPSCSSGFVSSRTRSSGIDG